LATVLAVCVVLVASASSAFAASADQSYGYQTDVGSVNSAAIADSLVWNTVAVSNADGRLFINRQFDFNSQAGGFEVLAPNGTSITQAISGNYPTGIAVSADGSAVYLLSEFGGAPVKLVSDGAPTPTYTRDPLWSLNFSPAQAPTGIAVDPVTGDVLVAAGGPVLRYSSTGALLSSIDGSTTDRGAFNAAKIAVAPNRDVYALDLKNRVEHMGADGSWKGSLNVPVGNGVWGARIGIAVNPQNNDVALQLPLGSLTKNDAAIRIFTAANDVKDTFRVPPVVASGSSGLAFAADGTKLYVGHSDDQVDGIAHELVPGTRPGLDAPTVSQITTTSFHLATEVATNGEPTTAHFEYCLASDPCTDFLTADAPSPWHALTDQAGLANPNGNDPIAGDVSGLMPNTDYLVRAYAINDAAHVENITAAVPVHTDLGPPVVQTGGARADEQSAELTGTIETLGGQTTYHFEYGLTTNYGSRVPASVEAVAGNKRPPRTFTQMVKGLQPGTTYHYRLVATNAAGTVAGADRTFTTLGLDQVAPHRGYEQVTAPNKKGLVVNGDWGFQASSAGGAIEYSATSPAADASSAAQVSRYISRRGDSDWTGQEPLDPPLNPGRVVVSSVTQAVSADFDHAMVVTTVALTPDAVAGQANIYVNDLETGAYRLVGSAAEPGAYTGMVGLNNQTTYMAGASDFSWIVLISRFPLLPNAPQHAMYKWSRTDGLHLLSLLPGDAIPTGNTWFESDEFDTNRLVSDDGNTVAFSLCTAADRVCSTGDAGVYRRSGGQTVPISMSQASGGPAGVQPGLAVGLSRDGRYVVFISPVQLTDDATASGMKIYRYDASTSGLEFVGLEDGTADGSRDVLAISDDGGTIYFNNPTSGTDSNGQPVLLHNVAVWRDGQVATVSETNGGLRNGAAFASSDGRYFEFMLGDTAVRLYDADTGDLACVSCTTSGEGGGGQLPTAQRTISNYHPRAVTDDGHAYFGTSRSLLPVDRNSTTDVYEYYKGRLTLISPGDRAFNVSLVDISPDGRDVFFTTSEGLVGQDADQAYDVYDARVGGGLAAQNPPLPDVPCARNECAESGPGPVASPPAGSSTQRGEPVAKRTRVSLGKVSASGRVLRIAVRASRAGRVTVTGARVRKTVLTFSKAGRRVIVVPLSKKARALRRAKRKLKVSVRVTLVGKGGGSASTKHSLTLGK
jgi:hypothetical protein